MHPDIRDRLARSFDGRRIEREPLLRALFADAELRALYPSDIRRATVIGAIANEILEAAGSAERCDVFAIGDIKFFGELETEWNRLVGSALAGIRPESLSGYDLPARGTPAMRTALTDYMRRVYATGAFPSDLAERIVPSYGGSDAFTCVLRALMSLAPAGGVRFVFPEASFPSNVATARMLLGAESVIALPKADTDDFFFRADQMPPKGDSPTLDLYYVTPVGNPTGNFTPPEAVMAVTREILARDPSAVFLFDTVYMGLLEDGRAGAFYEAVLSDAAVAARSVFTESLSKALGMTGVRIGWTWTPNAGFDEAIRGYASLAKAGYSRLLDAFATNLLSDPALADFERRAYAFWSAQRLGFRDYVRETHPDYFDFDASPRIAAREGLYVFLKLRDGVTAEEVCVETGMIGVPIALSDGTYVRYAFGNVRRF